MGRLIEVAWRIEGRIFVDEDELPKVGDHFNRTPDQVLDHAMEWIPELVGRFADNGEGVITDWEWTAKLDGASAHPGRGRL